MNEIEARELEIKAIGKEKRFRRDSIVIYSCLALGFICIGSSIFKTWASNVIPFDWFILGMGVALCGMSLFRKFEVGKSGFTAEIRELSKIMELKNK